MMTLIKKLCTLCAMSALMQMALPDCGMKGHIRMICGLLMLRLTFFQMKEIAGQLAQQTDLYGILSYLML